MSWGKNSGQKKRMLLVYYWKLDSPYLLIFLHFYFRRNNRGLLPWTVHFLTSTEIALVCWSKSCPCRPRVDAWTCHSCQEDTGPSCTRWKGKCCVGSRVWGHVFSTDFILTHRHFPKRREDLTCVWRGEWKSTSSGWQQHLVSDCFTWEKSLFGNSISFLFFICYFQVLSLFAFLKPHWI